MGKTKTNKMAASLIRRFVIQQSTRCARVLVCKNGFCSSSEGDDSKKYNSDLRLTPREQAIDKFSKLVEKVTLQNEEARKIEEQAEELAKSSQSESLQSQSKAETVDHDYLLTPVDGENSDETFSTMLRKSKLVSLGEFNGRLLQGNIIEVMDDDLYIDFGGKFHCVCPRPKRNGEKYRRGTRVLLQVKCMEMSSSFLGSDIDVTLLEADAVLLGLLSHNKSGIQAF